MRRDWRSIIVATVALATLACDSQRPPTAPSVDPPPSAAPPAPPFPAPQFGFLPAPPSVPTSSDPLVGRYTLDIAVAASSCESVPAHAQRRTYTADIHDHEDGYAVKLYDARFLLDGSTVSYGCRDRRLPYDGACHMLLMRRDGGSTVSVTMTPEDEWRGSEIWEVLPEDNPLRLLQLYGQATGLVRDERIDAAGPGGLWLGNGLPASIFHGCRGEVQLIFTRR